MVDSFNDLLNAVIRLLAPFGGFGTAPDLVDPDRLEEEADDALLRQLQEFFEEVRGLSESETDRRLAVAIQTGRIDLSSIGEFRTLKLPERDPETGQFIGGSSGSRRPEIEGELDDYDDLVYQNINWSHRVWFDATNGNDLPADGSQGLHLTDRFFPLGGREGLMERNEIAELVAIQFLGMMIVPIETGGAGTTPGTITAECELNRPGGGYNLNPGADPGPVGADIFRGAGDIDNGSIIPGGYTEVGGNQFHHAKAAAYTAFNDTVNGTGGGGSPGISAINPPIDLRQHFGRGPLFYPDEEMQVNGRVEWFQVENQGVLLTGRYAMWWDIFEFEERPLHEQISRIASR